MTISRKVGSHKRVPKAAAYKRPTAAAKIASAQRSAILEEKPDADLPLVNSPYGVFAPLLELATTPWRMFFPFTPWPVKRLEKQKGE